MQEAQETLALKHDSLSERGRQPSEGICGVRSFADPTSTTLVDASASDLDWVGPQLQGML